MKARARKMNANLSLQSNREGTEIILSFPTKIFNKGNYEKLSRNYVVIVEDDKIPAG